MVSVYCEVRSSQMHEAERYMFTKCEIHIMRLLCVMGHAQKSIHLYTNRVFQSLNAIPDKVNVISYISLDSDTRTLVASLSLPSPVDQR